MVKGCVLRTAGSFLYLNYADPLTSLDLLNYHFTLAKSKGRLTILCHQDIYVYISQMTLSYWTTSCSHIWLSSLKTTVKEKLLSKIIIFPIKSIMQKVSKQERFFWIHSILLLRLSFDWGMYHVPFFISLFWISIFKDSNEEIQYNYYTYLLLFWKVLNMFSEKFFLALIHLYILPPPPTLTII